jgi:A/G-specific adenine glycosylase
LVSEIMLQQTQVERVLGYYDRFLKKYPTVEELAAARPHEVREAWDGLGYYARARNLHQAARKVVERYDGQFPRSYDEAKTLPGVGSYTAGALLSFAFNIEAPTLDTNVKRLLSRLFIRRPSPRPAHMEVRLKHLNRILIPRGNAWTFNQALMDFGALICTARSPRCGICCFTDICQAYPKLMLNRGKRVR